MVTMLLWGLLVAAFLLVVLLLALRVAWATGLLLMEKSDWFWGSGSTWCSR